jgi:hypothetical protein
MRIATESRELFKELCRLEPGLQQLFNEARRVTSHGDPHFCANRVWYRELKPRLLKLVGWQSTRPDGQLHTTTSYDAAYSIIYGALPDCRDCWCLR